MSHSTASGVSGACHCGMRHPAGTVCVKAPVVSHVQSSTNACGCSGGAQIDHRPPQGEEQAEENEPPQPYCGAGLPATPSPCGCAEDPASAPTGNGPAHGGCCGQAHGPLVPLDLSSVSASSATRAVYRIVNMDCPMEEALIRKKLATVTGVSGLSFNLMRRVLTVDHALDSTQSIAEALRSIGMTSEPVGKGPVVVPAARVP